MSSQGELNAAFRAVFVPECEMRGIPIQAANKMADQAECVADQMERRVELACSQTIPEFTQEPAEFHAQCDVRNSELNYGFFFKGLNV